MRRLVVALGVLLGALALAPLVRADTQGSCTPTTNVSIRFYENVPSDHSNDDDSIWIVCNGGATAQNGNMANVPHVLPGECNGRLGDGSTWDNCTSTVRMWLPSSFWRFCAYTGYNMHGTVIANFTGPYWPGEVWFTGGYNDTLSSFRIRYAEGC